MKVKKEIALSDSGFLFNPLNGQSYTLNPLGCDVFNLIKDGKQEKEIIDIVVSEYDITASTFEKDFQDFVASMAVLGLIEID